MEENKKINNNDKCRQGGNKSRNQGLKLQNKKLKKIEHK